jgi:hypothetical protein
MSNKENDKAEDIPRITPEMIRAGTNALFDGYEDEFTRGLDRATAEMYAERTIRAAALQAVREIHSAD